METIDRGSASSARVAIVGGIHGDEPAGERIVRRLADELDEEGKGSGDEEGGDGIIRLIVANEPALAAGTRYTDTDLNRAFPGDTDSDEYERARARLAAELEGWTRYSRSTPLTARRRPLRSTAISHRRRAGA